MKGCIKMKKTNRRDFFKQAGIVTGSILISKPVLDLRKADRKKDVIDSDSITVRGIKFVDTEGNTFEETPFERSYSMMDGDRLHLTIDLEVNSNLEFKKLNESERQ